MVVKPQKPDAQVHDLNPSKVTSSSATLQLKLFDHLVRKSAVIEPKIEAENGLHPAITKLGCLYQSGLVYFDDDRVAALIGVFCQVVEDYTTPPNKSLCWDLDKHIKVQVQHLVDNRQMCMGMGNAIKYLRSAISCVPPDLIEANAKAHLIKVLRFYLEEKIIYARENIIKHYNSILKNDDTLLTFGSSPLIKQVLLNMVTKKKFHLMIVDTRPLNH